MLLHMNQTTRCCKHGDPWLRTLPPRPSSRFFFTHRQSKYYVTPSARRSHAAGPRRPKNLLKGPVAAAGSSSDAELEVPREPGSLQERRGNSLLGGALAVAVLVGSVLLCTSGSLQGLRVSANQSILGRSGFLAAFSLIFLSEIGDKTFFIAGLLATKVGKWQSLIGSTAALAIMTVISVGIGTAFKSLPEVLKSSLPVGQYLGAALMLLFGVRTIMDAWRAPGEASEGAEDGEFREAELSVSSAEKAGKMTQQGRWWQTLLQVGTLIFLAEWGDRSMLATIALGASHPPIGVATGATLAHAAATAIAVVGGALASQYVSEKTIGYIGGALFLLFAVLTFLGCF